MAQVEVKVKYAVKDATDEQGNQVYAEAQGMYDFGENLQDAVDRFGADVVFSNFVSAAKVKIQAIMRTKKQAGTSDADLQTFLDGYKVGMVLERTQVNPMEAFKASFQNASPERQKELLRELGLDV